MASSSGGTHTTPIDTRRRILRISFACLLLLAFLGSIGFILFNWPLPLTLAAILIMVAAASAAVFAAYFVPAKPSVRFKRAFTVGVAAVGVITALVAVPALQNSTTGPESPVSAAAPTTPSPQPSTPSPLPDPLTAELGFKDCENFTLPTSQLRVLSKLPSLDARWIYEHGGASGYQMYLIVQGESEDAVVLQRLRVIDLTRSPVPDNLANIFCGGTGGLATRRYFDINLGNPPRIVSKPAPDADQDTGKKMPAAKFPFKVSNSDPEYFELYIIGPPCFCEWRLALDWTSRGRSGTTILDHGFGRIRTDIGAEDEERPNYLRYEDGTWDPPLPK